MENYTLNKNNINLNHDFANNYINIDIKNKKNIKIRKKEIKFDLLNNSKVKNKINIKISNIIKHIINNYLFFILILLIRLLPIECSNKNIKKLNSINEIYLKIKVDNSMHINILGEVIDLPSEVYINESKKEYNERGYRLEKGENNIIFKWDSPLTTCRNMFYCLEYLISVDFSNFDSSKITDMQNMFFRCSKLKLINFGNFNTSLVNNMDHLFYGCFALTSLDLSNFDTSLVTTMKSMFNNCINLISLDISNFDTYSLETMDSMFNNATSLISIDLSNFNTSSLTLARNVFTFCNSLIYIKFFKHEENSSYDAYNFITMENFENFVYCIDELECPKTFIKIKEKSTNNNCSHICFQESRKIIIKKKKCIDDCLNDDTYTYEYNNFCYDSEQNISNDSENILTEIYTETNINNIENTEIIESDETKSEIITERISNIETNYIETNVNNSQTEELKDNDITQSNYDDEKTQNNVDVVKSQVYENDDETQEVQNTDKIDIEEKPSDIETNEEKSSDLETNDEQSTNIELNEEKSTNIGTNEEISTNIETIEEISTNIEFNEEKSTDIGTNEEISTNIEINEEKSIDLETNEGKLSDIETNEEKSTDINTNEEKSESIYFNEKDVVTQIFKKFSSENFFKEIEELNNEEEFFNRDNIIQYIKRDIINGSLDTLLGNLTNGKKEDLIASNNEIIYQITTTDNQKNNIYSNLSTINLGDCEDKLKDTYEIEKNLSLIIFKVEYDMPGLLIPVIGYEVYHPINKSQLDLNYCKDYLVKINIPVSIDEDNLYKYDPTSEYYNDQCSTYTTDNGTDIILNDRINEYIDNNLSLCENNCTYKGYDKDSKKALCECDAKINIESISTINNIENILSNNIAKDNTTSNFVVIKCINTLFTKDGLITNIASYILIIAFLFFAISSIIFYKCGNEIIENYIYEILRLKKKNKKISKKTNKKNIFNINSSKKRTHKKRKKIKDKKNKKISNPIKKKEIDSSNKTINPPIHNSFHSSKLQLKNTNIFIHLEKKEKNKKDIFKKVHKNKNNNIKREDQINNYKDVELNLFDYQKALTNDKRSFCQYYLSLILSKNILLFSFYPINDYNLKIIKLDIFFLSLIIYISINTFFFNIAAIHQVYEEKGSYNIIYFMPQIIYSFLLSYYIIIIIKYFSLSQRNLLEIKKEENFLKSEDKAIKVKRCLMIKYILFYIINFIFIITFWYYLSSFCAVFKNSQIYLIKNTFISFGISLLYPIIFYLIPCLLRIISLKNRNECLYNISKIFQFI